MSASMLTKPRVETMRQIHRAGFAFIGKFGWTVNGWKGSGPTKFGPTDAMMAALIDAAFLAEVASRNPFFREFQLTPFGVSIVLRGEPLPVEPTSQEQP